MDIYIITNKVNGRVYIGQTEQTFKERYKGETIKHVYKTTHNLDLKKDIEIYNECKYWEIESEYDIAYSKESLNKKEYAAFLICIFESSEIIKRDNIKLDIDGSRMRYNGQLYCRDYIPKFFYNKVTPMKVNSRDRTKRYIYTTDKLCIMFKSQKSMREYKEYWREITNKYTNRSITNVFYGDGGFFYIPWIMKWRMKNNLNIPRINNINKCYLYYTEKMIDWFYESVFVKYTGTVSWKRNIYKPIRRINITRIEVLKDI